jgi:DinB superfamily
MPRPVSGDAAAYYEKYMNLVKGETIEEIISNHSSDIENFIASIPVEKENYSYAEGKWTVKESLQHIIDTERVFSYRAMCISRKDETSFPGFDENNYTVNAGGGARILASLKDEFAATRKSTDILLQSFTEEQLKQRGIASNNPITVNAIAYIIYGHLLHHINIFKERYGV